MKTMITDSDVKPPSTINGKGNPAYYRWWRIKHRTQTDEQIRAKWLANLVGARAALNRDRSKQIMAVKNSVAVKNAARENQKKAAGMAIKMNPQLYSKGAGGSHIGARVWSIRDPFGKSYRFKNLNFFIRENPFLFQEEDVVWKTTPSGQMECKARGGIKSIKPSRRRKKLNLSWKGWTWITLDERALNQGVDLLERTA